MSKTENETEKNWKYNGNEDEWDIFDRRMLRYMRKKYDVFGERLWMGELHSLMMRWTRMIVLITAMT